MTVKEFINTLEEPVLLIFMETIEERRREICKCNSGSSGTIPYLDKEIVSWKVSKTIVFSATGDYAPVVVTLRGEE